MPRTIYGPGHFAGNGLLDTGTGHTLDDLTLGDQEDHQQREQTQHGRGHHLGLADRGGAEQAAQTHRDGLRLGLGQHQQRQQEGVPGADEGEDGDREMAGRHSGMQTSR